MVIPLGSLHLHTKDPHHLPDIDELESFPEPHAVQLILSYEELLSGIDEDHGSEDSCDLLLESGRIFLTAAKTGDELHFLPDLHHLHITPCKCSVGRFICRSEAFYRLGVCKIGVMLL